MPAVSLLHASKPSRYASSALLLLTFVTGSAFSQAPPLPQRKVLGGVTSTRPIHGAPYDLAGNRVVFTNWYYIQPGDLDWQDASGKSNYVKGNAGPFDAHHVGINAPHGIRIMAEKPQVIGPIDHPHRMIMRDGNLYKGWTDSDYYESTDGMQWTKKAALKFDAPITDGLYDIFIDPIAPPAERYKAVWVGEITRAQFDAYRAKYPNDWEPHAIFVLGEKDSVSCIRGSVSADGIAWKTLPDPLVVEYSDSLNTAYYDSVLHQYVLYTRYWDIGGQSGQVQPDVRNSWTGLGRRAIGRSASNDFRHFSPSTMILEPSMEMLPSEQLYTNCYTTIPGAPDEHLMFPAIWNGSVDDTTRIAFASSHDGQNWQWVPGGDLLYTQPFGQWNGGCIWVLPNLIELPNGDWALPYLAENFPHKYPRGQLVGHTGYAVWPKGRLCGVDAADEGEFTMMPIVAKGNTLKINALTLRTGWIKIEVLGVKGHTLAECTPIIGDQQWAQVTWKDSKDLGITPGQPITLRVQMKQAKLYGLEID